MDPGVKIVFDENDLPYEEEILRNPCQVKSWMRYIDHKKKGDKRLLNLIHERALKELPGCYKIWHSYLTSRVKQVKNKCINDPSYEEVNNAFERSLVFMHKMPRIWLDYCEFMIKQVRLTRTRHIFDRALRALPVTQHRRIWSLYLPFVTEYSTTQVAITVYRRYLKLCPENAEDYIEYLISIDRLDEAARKLADVLNREHFVSLKGKSKHQLWNELCDLISKNPDKITSLKVDAIIRGGIKQYTDQLGHLWNSLADYYVRSGLFERARDIYEEAIEHVTTVRDFTQIFDAYSQFEELSLEKKLQEIQDNPNSTEDDEIELNLKMARLVDLTERRLFMLNTVQLKQNPHNVREWHFRVQILEGNEEKIINTYNDAIKTVDPKLAVGKLHTLWVAFAKFYEENNNFEEASIIFEKSTKVAFVELDDLATVWCEWAEMEVRREKFDDAIKLMRKATAQPSHKVAHFDENKPAVQLRLHTSFQLWSMYADLEESFGTFETCKAVYDRMIDLRIASPQIIINYGLFLEANKYFEEQFRAYEKCVELFGWPNVYDIWIIYLRKFLLRNAGHLKKESIKWLPRARDLFNKCLEKCPAKHAKEIYLLMADMEERYGNPRHVIQAYIKATEAVLPEERLSIFQLYINKARVLYGGIDKPRQIYLKAINAEDLEEDAKRHVCIKFAELETEIKEYDRARAIYAHCSQMCDPRVQEDFWERWTDFEVAHGNESTLKEMRRIKRTVQALYNSQVRPQMLATATNSSSTVADLAPGSSDGMRLLEARAAKRSSEVTGTTSGIREVSFVRGVTQGGSNEEDRRVINPDEMDIDDSDHDENTENSDDENEEKDGKTTTAARPTFEPARGGQGRGEKDLGARSEEYSSRDLPGCTKLKYREYGQGTTDELNVRDFRRELEEKEREQHEREREKALRGRIPDPPNKKQQLEILPVQNLDADDVYDSEEDNDDDSDDDEILLAELARVKEERANEQMRKEQEKKKGDERIRTEILINGNPLLHYSTQAPESDIRVKRRWDEDVVFKNYARSEPDKKEEFINDNLRSEFHKKFISKYMK